MNVQVIFAGCVSKEKGSNFDALVFSVGTFLHSYTRSTAKNKPISDNFGNTFTDAEFVARTKKLLSPETINAFLGKVARESISLADYESQMKILFPPKEKISARLTFEQNLNHWKKVCPSL